AVPCDLIATAIRARRVRVDAVCAGFGNEQQRAARRLRFRKVRHRKTCQSRRCRPKKLSPSDCHLVMLPHKDASAGPAAVFYEQDRGQAGDWPSWVNSQNVEE